MPIVVGFWSASLGRLAWSMGSSRTGRAPFELFEERRGLTMTTGTIKRIISERGFGFIADPDGKEYFFHKDGLAPSLDFDRQVGGESVSFEVEAGPKGPRAVQVQTA
jgi:CspA family cold shock protein